MHLLDRELEIIPGPPLAENLEFTEYVLDNTLLRTQRIVRSRAEDDLKPATRGVSLKNGLSGLRAMANADIRRTCVGHHCEGCCENEDGGHYSADSG